MTQPSRGLLAGTAAALAVLGVLFVTVLVADNDNAYLYLAVVGGGLVLAALPFAVAALLPVGWPRRLVARAALMFVSLVGVLGGALLLVAVAIIPSQNYGSNTVLVSHVVGLVLLIAALVVLLRIYRRQAK